MPIMQSTCHCERREANNSLFVFQQVLDEEKLNALVMLSDIIPTSYEVGDCDGQLKPVKTLAIVGFEPVGLAAIIHAKLYSPSKIIAIDIDNNCFEKPIQLGADVRHST